MVQQVLDGGNVNVTAIGIANIAGEGPINHLPH